MAKLWTIEEDRRLRELKATGMANAVIATKLDRTLNSVLDRLRWLKKTPEERLSRRAQVNSNRQKWRCAARPEINVTKINRPSEELFAERDRRLAVPRTIGSLILGDPPPGYSALDRKRQGLPV